MKLLAVNTGSSSVRLALIAGKKGSLSTLANVHYSGSSLDPASILRKFLNRQEASGVTAVAHRIVHGGPRLDSACALDETVEEEIGRLAPLAPLHNPVAVRWIAASRVLPAGLLPPGGYSRRNSGWRPSSNNGAFHGNRH